MTRRVAPMGLLACVALACMTLFNNTPYVHAEAAIDNVQPGVPMKSVPVNLMPRALNGRQSQREKTLAKFQPTNSIQLRFIDATDENYANSGPCHHVDMDVELRTEAEKPQNQRPIQAINPFAFQHAVKSFSCTGKGADLQLSFELSPEYADRARRWNMGPSKVFAIAIPHDFVDLKKNQACFSALNEQAAKWAKNHPMETVIKLVKNPRFSNDKNKRGVVTFTVVKTDIWSQMNRVQSVRIAHRDMDEMLPKVFSNYHKRSIAQHKGPMWDFERNLKPATNSINKRMTADNVKANLDKSTVKGYAQADISYSQTCFKNIFTGKYHCLNWGINSSKISGMTEINHMARVDIKRKNVGRHNGPSDPMLTLTRVNVTTPTFNIVAPMPLLGFSVPGVFDLGANIGIIGAVNLHILVQATEDLLVNTGTASSCPWTVDWNGSLTSMPVINFGTCTLPGTPKWITNPGQALSIEAHDNAVYIGPDPIVFSAKHMNARNARVNVRNAVLAAVPSAPVKGSRKSAVVRLGMDVTPSLGLGLKVFGLNALSAGLVAPLALGINTHWDTQKTNRCPANNVAIFADGQATLMLEGTFFGFSRNWAPLTSPPLNSPPICIAV
ncbi:hypothetical protein BGX23_007759 [Mortierella sp. AD031]|nr:hypothetical protein BGX23_007759 [Mortierella sp. AD031]